LVQLPGVGPGGSTLYASDFFINNFQFVSESTSGSNLIVDYTADFSVAFKDGLGNAIPGAYANLLAGTAANFIVQYDNRSDTHDITNSPFIVHLLEASFSGNTSAGSALSVSLTNNPAGIVSIAPHTPFGYDITWGTPFIIGSQYTTPVGTYNAPALGDVNGGSPTPPPGTIAYSTPANAVPEPATLALFVPGLLGLFGARRRAALS
jgi:hypothetical protein